MRRDGKRLLRWNLHRRRCRRPLRFATHLAMAPAVGCWLGFGKREFCEDLGLLSFNLARKALIREERKRFWRESGGVAAGFGARASREGRGRVEGRGCRTRSRREGGGERSVDQSARTRLRTDGVVGFSRAKR